MWTECWLPFDQYGKDDFSAVGLLLCPIRMVLYDYDKGKISITRFGSFWVV